ncbi:MAG: hypothetical protein AAFV53_19030 [Myxococcota bacterium]
MRVRVTDAADETVDVPAQTTAVVLSPKSLLAASARHISPGISSFNAE